ncbi:right-handed parallel beta-helix repeat-containing protein [Paenibacillus sp. OV219]|uniref:right-handed parallel beta-helix repeat-containing protein n=1 Tax=Paenibacillus sp. OV219 TaxID=1884377 RepID=UPI0008B2391E|nr:right-handed parallel beta-helix repeat-containing protein [Paenibacillus sp. OV219]SEO63785.1 Pectate lyase superfamily protein [Paenibacillus sp. OV219]
MGVTQIYAGPTLPDEGLKQFDVFMDGIIPAYLQPLMSENNDVDLLTVAMEQFSNVYVAAGTPGTPENAAYLRLSNNIAPPTEDGDMLKSVYDLNNDGIVDQAAKLQVARTISLTGDATGSAAFDGSANISIQSTIPTATPTVKGLLSAADKTKLDGVATGATNYTHPATHPAAMITDDAGHRFVSDSEKAIWNAKGDMQRSVYDTNTDGIVDQAEKLQTARTIAINGDVTGTTTFDGSANVAINAAIPTASPNAKGLMTALDKVKLDGIATGATNYVHPATHPATMITDDAGHRFVSDSEKTTWNAKGDMQRSFYDTDNDGIIDQAEKLQTARTIAINGDVTGTTIFDGSANVTINAAIPTVTPNAKGLMNASDKAKLDGVATGANNYTHPATHPATMITEDTTHRFVTDTEKATWNAAASGPIYDTNNDGIVDKSEKLATARNITLSGTINGSAAFDGSSNVTITTTGGGDMLRSTYDTNNDGTVDKAAKLAIARTISMTGSVAGSASFDGSANISIVTTGSSVVGNVKGYGAVGNGVTDDTAAIQACLNATKVAYFPPGTYVMSTVTVPAYSTVYGDGRGSVILKPKTGMTGNMFSVNGGYSTFKDFQILGNDNPNVTAIGDVDPARTAVYHSIQCMNLIIWHVGNAIKLTGRGEDYLFEKLYTFSNSGYGVYMENISDSAMINCQIGGSGACGVRLFNGGSFRFVGIKFLMNGTDMTGKAGVEVYNTLSVTFTGCEIQQNVYDGMLLRTVHGVCIAGTLFDSNNQKDIVGLYGQLNLQDCENAHVTGVMTGGRFENFDPPPWNTPGMYGIVQDDKCAYNYFNMQYLVYDKNWTKHKQFIAPFYTPVNDISSKFICNNVDYFNFPSTALVFGTNAALSSSSNTGGTFNVATSSVNSGNQINFTQQSAGTLPNGAWYLNRSPLTMAQFTGTNSPTGKAFVYVSYESKVMSRSDIGLQINMSLTESSTTHSTASSTGIVKVTGTNKNEIWVQHSCYKPLSYSNEAGFQVNLDFNITYDISTGGAISNGDVLASVRNIRVGFY